MQNQITLNEAANLISTVGRDVTFMLVGEPGVGKSSILKTLEEQHGDAFEYIYVDCPVKDIPDVGMSIPDHQMKVLEYYTGSVFKLNNPKPKLIMLDEMLKAPNLIKLIFTRLILERMVGDCPLPQGSMVFCTSNNVSDGVGDSIAGHLQNRLSMVQVKKPSADEWLNWAIDNDVAPEICAWVNQYPRAMASYLDGDQKDNPYIYNPKQQKGAFVSPRSLAKASYIVKNRDALGENATMVSLAGMIGAPAAADMAAFLHVADKLPTFGALMEDPENIKLPEEIPALLIMLFGLIARITDNEVFANVMKITDRVKHKELQTLFMTSIMRSSKAAIAARHPAFTKWAAENAKFY